MLSLAVLCAFHYFLADILGNNLFLSQFFFLFAFFSLSKKYYISLHRIYSVFWDPCGSMGQRLQWQNQGFLIMLEEAIRRP